MRERVRQLENRGCVKWFGGERKSRLPPSPLSSVEVFLRVHPKVQYDGAEGEADMLLRNFLFPLLLGKELRIAPRKGYGHNRPTGFH